MGITPVQVPWMFGQRRLLICLRDLIETYKGYFKHMYSGSVTNNHGKNSCINYLTILDIY